MVMSDSPQCSKSDLAKIVIDQSRYILVLRQEALAAHELVSLTLDELHEKDKELDRVRDRYHALLNERRKERESLKPKAAA
jgi:hypothetical protein